MYPKGTSYSRQRVIMSRTRIRTSAPASAIMQSDLHVVDWILGRGLLTFGAAIFGLFVIFTLVVQL